MKLRVAALAFAVVAIAALSAGAQELRPTPVPSFVPYDPDALPTGAVGDSIRLGRSIVTDTQTTRKGYVTARMECAACHVDGGTRAHAGSFVGTYSYFPQWNRRAGRVITLQDRLAECFLYSMNGRPPNFASQEMVGLVAYIAWLSRGTPAFSEPSPANRFIDPLPSASPDVANGAKIYAGQCAACHQAGGAGIAGAFPPLWGPTSFNDLAGMAHIDRMTGFVHHNMPQGNPGSLSLEDAYDVSAFVLSHARPVFKGKVPIEWSPLPAEYF